MRLRVLLTLAGVALACAGPRTGEARRGEIAVEWRGASRGAFRAEAAALRCIETGLVELLVIRGDSGIGLVFFPADSATLAAGEYPVFVPTVPDEPRPGAVVALRWFHEGNTLAYQGLRGVVTVAGSGRETGTMTGSLELTAQVLEGADTLRVTGQFRAVPVDSAPTGCGELSRRNPQ